MGLISDIDMMQLQQAGIETLQDEPRQSGKADAEEPTASRGTEPQAAVQEQTTVSIPTPPAEQVKADDASDEDKKRAEYEAAEQVRKAEFEAKQKAKKEALEKQLVKVAAMSDEEVVQASMKAVDEGVERLTRRNMPLSAPSAAMCSCKSRMEP